VSPGLVGDGGCGRRAELADGGAAASRCRVTALSGRRGLGDAADRSGRRPFSGLVRGPGCLAGPKMD